MTFNSFRAHIISINERINKMCVCFFPFFHVRCVQSNGMEFSEKNTTNKKTVMRWCRVETKHTKKHLDKIMKNDGSIWVDWYLIFVDTFREILGDFWYQLNISDTFQSARLVHIYRCRSYCMSFFSVYNMENTNTHTL